jgi:hypothetical protein
MCLQCHLIMGTALQHLLRPPRVCDTSISTRCPFPLMCLPAPMARLRLHGMSPSCSPLGMSLLLGAFLSTSHVSGCIVPAPSLGQSTSPFIWHVSCNKMAAAWEGGQNHDGASAALYYVEPVRPASHPAQLRGLAGPNI